MTPRHLLNVKAFALFVHVSGQKYPRMIDAAEAAGISKAQFFRALHKQPVNNQAFLSLCLWMGMNPYSFLLDAGTGRGLAPLPEAPVSRATSTETRGLPQIAEAA
jgi:hypothetical protein